MEVRKAIIIEARRFGPLLLSEFRIIIIILYIYIFWVWDFSVALCFIPHFSSSSSAMNQKFWREGGRTSSEFWTLNWTDSGWCSRALTGRSGEFRPTAAAAAAGQFQCAPNLCFEFGMQKWKTRVFILHFLNFETLVAIIFTLKKNLWNSQTANPLYMYPTSPVLINLVKLRLSAINSSWKTFNSSQMWKWPMKHVLLVPLVLPQTG